MHGMSFEVAISMEKTAPSGLTEENGDLRLDELVLDYIRHHHEGVQITVMEQKFKESRMRIGFITKRLLNDGKILRIQDDFFPSEEL